MVQQPSDKRSFSRVSCETDVWQADPPILLGKMRDLGLQGAFVSTPAPLPLKAVLSLRFSLDGEDVQAEAEVVRVIDTGMGLRFLGMARQDAKRLRKYVVGAVGALAYRDVVEKMHDAGASVTRPVTDTSAIKSLLQESKESTFLLLSMKTSKRHTAKIYHMDADMLGVLCDTGCTLHEGEAIFALYTRKFISYSFKATVRRVNGNLCEMSVPTSLLYSERRSSQRTPVPGAIFTFSRGARAAPVAWEVIERSETGISLRVKEMANDLWPGVVLPEASIFADGKHLTLVNVIVQNVSRIEEDGFEWYRVGLSHGFSHRPVEESSETVSGQLRPRRLRARIKRTIRSLADAAMYVLHSKILPAIQEAPESAPEAVHFANAQGKPLVGLLNVSWPKTSARVRAPLVIVTPGFGARKETMGALAYILTHAFGEEDMHIAVLRYDGSNNVGESFKEAGCDVEGKETLQFTISDGVDDIVGANAWAESNPIVEPTEVIVISVSFSSVAVRHALAKQYLKNVSLWIPFMGAADAANAVMNVGGHIDGYGNYLKGIKNGLVTLLGCLADADNVCRDMQELQVATLADAKRDMASIEADVLWIAGTHDAYMDIERTRQVMSVHAKGKREIIEVDAGHVPQTSEEAISEFAIIARVILKHLQVKSPRPISPPRGWIGAMSEREWSRIRKSRGAKDRLAWWRSHWTASKNVGEVLVYSPYYEDLLQRIQALVPDDAKKVADLGCGAGVLTERLLAGGSREVIGVDFVQDALDEARRRNSSSRMRFINQSIDGNTIIGVRRWVRGEIPDVGEAVKSLPPQKQKQIIWLANLHDSRIHSAMRGYPVDFDRLADELSISQENLEGLKDMNALSRLATQRVPISELVKHTSPSVLKAISGQNLWPFATGWLDCVVCSLVLNFLVSPSDTISECYRVLKRGGRLIVAVYVEDADMSQAYIEMIEHIEKRPFTQSSPSKSDVLDAARNFNNFASQMHRLEEEGTFRKYNERSLVAALGNAGFTNVQSQLCFGEPHRAVIAAGTKE